MNIKILLIIIVLTPSAHAVSQSIFGKVLDANNEPIEFVNVALYSLPDSILIAGTVTGSNGEFTLNSDDGKAFLQISFMGYETQTIPFASEQTVILRPENTELGELVVKGNLPKIRLRNDALVTTVQNSVLSKAGTGNDVLKRLPLISGDNGSFSIFGKGDAKIFINNREMRDISELDNLNSSDIKEVEIITSPGARYDASVEAVIRISTMPKAGDGFSFDIRSSYWQSQNTDLREQLNINYRNYGLDIFGTIYYNHNESIQDSELQQETHVDTLWVQDNNLISKRHSNTLRGIAGINYEISPKHYLGIRYTMSAFPSEKSSSTMNSIVNANGNFYDKWNSLENVRFNNKPSHRLNAYYNGSFKELDLDINADYYNAKLYSRSVVTETSQEFEDRTVNSENNVNNSLFASKLVLSYPLLDGRFSLGGEYTRTNRKDSYQNAENIVVSSKNSIQEQNNSLFVEYSRATPIGQFGAGLRYENVHSEHFVNNERNTEQSRNYNQWFPNFSYTTAIKNVTLQLAYNTKTNRPAYRQLSSNVYYGNRFTLQTGNPFLKPSVTNDLSLVGVWRFIQIMASYKTEKDVIIFWTEQMETNPSISILSHQNLEKLPSFTAFISLSPTFGIWSPQLSGGFVKQWLTITSNKQPVTLNKPIAIASLNNSFSLSNGFSLTLDVSFQGSGNTQNVYLTEEIIVANVGIVKSFLDDQLRVELKGHDIFKGKKDGNLLFNKQMELYQLNRYDSREIELTLRYKFNSSRSKYKGTGAGQEEINRLN